MRKTPAAIILSLGLLLTPSLAFADFCESKWPLDYKMQAYCKKKQSKSLEEIFGYLKHYGLYDGGKNINLKVNHVPSKIFIMCYSKWKEDTVMVRYCIKEQEESARAIGKLE